MQAVTSFEDSHETPAVRGFLHTPDEPTGHGLVLTHGAGSNAGAPLLIAIADAFCAAGIAVLRCDLPFRQARPHGPPFPAMAAQDRAGLARAVRVLRNMLRERLPGKVFLGGHSYGGGQSPMLAAGQPALAGGLLLFSYPLPPPPRSWRRPRPAPGLACFCSRPRSPPRGVPPICGPRISRSSLRLRCSCTARA